MFCWFEGCWYGNKKVYIVLIDGGLDILDMGWGEGIIFEYMFGKDWCCFNVLGNGGFLKVIYVFFEVVVLENFDNIVVIFGGGFLFCEDNFLGVFNEVECLIGMMVDGGVFIFVVNNVNFIEVGLGVYICEEFGLMFDFDEW